MNILDSVLEYCKPAEWENAIYTSKSFYLFDLQPGDEEYETEVQPFLDGIPRLIVKSLKRYQNPFLLGRIKIRKEQLTFRGEVVNERKYYHAVSKHDLNTALEYNMDVRRYENKNGCSIDSKNPKFYQTPGAAYNTCTANGISDKAIIVCKVLCTYNENNPCKNNDAEYMPMYVAEI